MKSEAYTGFNVHKARWQALHTLLEAWRQLDADLIYDVLAENFQYSSHWGVEAINSRDAYCTYLAEHFETLRKANAKPEITIVRFRHRLEFYAYALLMRQEGEDALLCFMCDGEKVSRLHIIGAALFKFKELPAKKQGS